MDSQLDPETKRGRARKDKRGPQRRGSPYAQRRAGARHAARARVRRRTKQPISAAQQAIDTLSRPRSSTGRRLGIAFGVLALSAAVHVAVLTIGLLTGGTAKEVAKEQLIRIEVAPPPPPPPPPPPEPEPEPEPEPVAAPEPPPVKPPPKPKAAPEPLPVAPEPPPPAPPPPDSKPPPRIVGLSLDSTAAGGDGPAFAVGNTRAGNTAQRAVDPTQVAPVGVAPPDAPPSPNQVATRIPTLGSKIVLPKRKDTEGKPAFPESLKSQGIEGDVVVMATIDEQGKVSKAKVIGKVSYPEFADAALAYVRSGEYQPATRDGAPIVYTITFTVKFRIED